MADGFRVEFKQVGPSLLDRLLRGDLVRNTADVTNEAAQDMEKDIRSNWSKSSPSAPGQPPAVVTGALDASVMAVPEQSLSTGKVTATVQVRDKKARHLEYGTRKMAARPFLRPAIQRAKRGHGKRYKVIFKG